MQFITITLISIGLAMDALAVSLGIGTAGQIATVRGKIRLAAHFGLFQSGMTALGWLAAQRLSDMCRCSTTGLHLSCWPMWRSN